MTTVIGIFIISLVFSLCLTPLAKRIGIHFGAIDLPDARKIHRTEIPRTGGMAIFFSFIISIFITKFFVTTIIAKNFIIDERSKYFAIGCMIAFGIGVIDDFKRLGPGIKFVFQVVAATIAFWGGIRIQSIGVGKFVISFGIISYFVTVFWFLLFINAINLIDGLDGLAGGISVFCCCMMIFLSMIRKDYWSALVFASLTGSILGFLRYNFNPASIFMGDGGSYFIGFAIAGLSILSSVKSQVSASILIPLIALGLPVFDAIFAPIRRFLVGKEMFKPDRSHIHHRLIEMGLSTKKAVLILYIITILLCCLAILVVNFRNEHIGFVLIIVGIGMIVIVQKLGYLEYFGSDKIIGWFKDISDEVGFSRSRRSFLNIQMEITTANNLSELWEKICNALDVLKFDRADLLIASKHIDITQKNTDNTATSCALKNYPRFPSNPNQVEWHYERPGFILTNDSCKECLLKLELPLLDNQGFYGTLWMIKDLNKDPISHYTLRRVEHLRRSIVSALSRLVAYSQEELLERATIPSTVNTSG